MVNYLWNGFLEALELLITFDQELYDIIFLSLFVSGYATIIASVLGIPLGALVAIKKFHGKQVVKNITFTLMGLPSVVAGLIVLLLLSRSGPLGVLGLLYTIPAMIIVQVVLGVPIVMAISISTVSSISKDVRETAMSLGANNIQTTWKIIQESKIGLITAIITTFTTCISEVGAVMMVGGNIQYQTRVLTTATVLNTSMGNYGYAIALGLVLLIMTFIITIIMLRFQNKHGTVEEKG